MIITYCMTVKEMKKVLKNKKDNEILDFDIFIDTGFDIDKVDVDIYCRNLDTKDSKQIVEMSDGMVTLYNN